MANKPSFSQNRAAIFFFFFFSKFYLRQSLNSMVSYRHLQYQKQLVIQSSENLMMYGRTHGQE